VSKTLITTMVDSCSPGEILYQVVPQKQPGTLLRWFGQLRSQGPSGRTLNNASVESSPSQIGLGTRLEVLPSAEISELKYGIKSPFPTFDANFPASH